MTKPNPWRLSDRVVTLSLIRVDKIRNSVHFHILSSHSRCARSLLVMNMNNMK